VLEAVEEATGGPLADALHRPSRRISAPPTRGEATEAVGIVRPMASGSIDSHRTAAGVASRSGMRSSARAWSSTETPSQTFGRGARRAGKSAPSEAAADFLHGPGIDKRARTIAPSPSRLGRPHPIRALRQHLKDVLRA
jgi:hypothetical protein